MTQTGPLSSAPLLPCFLHHDTWVCTVSALLCAANLHTHSLALHWHFPLPGTFQPNPAPPNISPHPLPCSPAQLSRAALCAPALGNCPLQGTSGLWALNPTALAPLKGTEAPGGQTGGSVSPSAPGLGPAMTRGDAGQHLPVLAGQTTRPLPSTRLLACGLPSLPQQQSSLTQPGTWNNPSHFWHLFPS